ncbi:MAG TPA: GNAT family N-acetyltransferase, partial [Polyangia bacterium]|nr:GNAT family N-acetyltransferase [Polyangia bacterium]
AQGLFAEAFGPFESIVAVREDGLVGFAQLDPATDRLRAVFVDGDLQHRGIGRLLLAEIERRVRRRGGKRLHGAMSLNAVPFYARAGFRPLGGPDRLTSAGISVPVVRMEKLFRGS